MGVDIFFSLMRSYFCLLVAALRPCQGRDPRLKYIRTYPSDSKSSRLDCSVNAERGPGQSGSGRIRVINHQFVEVGLTDAQMCVNGGVAGGACQVLVLAVGDVLVRACVTIFLGQAKVDDVDEISLLAQAHQEVVWLYVSVDEVLGVDVLNSADLEGKTVVKNEHKGSFQELNQSRYLKSVKRLNCPALLYIQFVMHL